MALLTRAAGALERIFLPRAKQFQPLTMSSSSGGYVPPEWPWNFWQLGYDPIRPGGGAIVHACIASYSQTASMCPGTHWRSTGDGGRERVGNSALSRILKKPNTYQSISDFVLNLVGSLYADGNAYALALRNNRFEVDSLHLMDPASSQPRVSVTGEVFYNLAGNPVVDNMISREMLGIVPARDVLHVKLDARNRNPLLGEAPLASALLDVAASNNMVRQALNYTANQARPSGVLMTDEPYTREETDEARARWDEMTKGAGAGGTPILTRGLKWQQTSTTSRDAQLAEMLQITDGRIATVYRVPLPLLSLWGAPVQSASMDDLMRFWVASSFGFALNHIEEAIGRFFQLLGWPDEYLEFDTAALERSNLKDRIEALARGVQGGIYAPNEARALEDLPAAKDGDSPRVQQQVVPLEAWSKPPPETPRPDAPPAPPPAANDDAAAEAAVKEAAVNQAKRAGLAAMRSTFYLDSHHSVSP